MSLAMLRGQTATKHHQKANAKAKAMSFLSQTQSKQRRGAPTRGRLISYRRHRTVCELEEHWKLIMHTVVGSECTVRAGESGLGVNPALLDFKEPFH